jgi:hypothetical protein
MKATQEQREIALDHFSQFEKHRMVEFAKQHKTQGYSLTRFTYDVFYASGLNKVLFEKYGYENGLTDDNLGSLVRWVLKRLFNIEYQRVRV